MNYVNFSQSMYQDFTEWYSQCLGSYPSGASASLAGPMNKFAERMRVPAGMIPNMK